MGYRKPRKVKHNNKKKKVTKKSSISDFFALPNHLVAEVLIRVASFSPEDFFKAQLSCKKIYQMADDNYIYKQVCLDEFQLLPWTEENKAFLRRCKESGNPEALFRQGVVDYFDGLNTMESGLEYLTKSANCGHLGASYVLGVVLLCSGDKLLKEQGMQLLDYVKVNRRLGYCRRRLNEIIRTLWRNRIRKIDVKPNSCPMQEKHTTKEGWPNLNIDDEDDKVGCNECSFNREVRLVCELI